jgi:predicted nucleic acid-binding protein
MIAVDTNVLVRVVTNDRVQARRALRRMQSDRIWISRTVRLETAWGVEASRSNGAWRRARVRLRFEARRPGTGPRPAVSLSVRIHRGDEPCPCGTQRAEAEARDREP